MNTHLSFACDYMEGTHPAILQKLVETNLEKTGGYGLDPYCDAAKEKIKAACGCPEGEVFLSGRRHPDQCYCNRCTA